MGGDPAVRDRPLLATHVDVARHHQGSDTGCERHSVRQRCISRVCRPRVSKEPVTRAGVSLRHWRPEEGPAWDRPLHLEWTETHRGRRGSRDTRPAPADALEVRTASQGKHWGAWPSRGWAARRCCPPALALCPSRRYHAEAKPLASKHPPAVGTAERSPLEHTASCPGLPRRAAQLGSPPPVTPTGVGFRPCGWQLPPASLPG